MVNIIITDIYIIRQPFSMNTQDALMLARYLVEDNDEQTVTF